MRPRQLQAALLVLVLAVARQAAGAETLLRTQDKYRDAVAAMGTARC